MGDQDDLWDQNMGDQDDLRDQVRIIYRLGLVELCAGQESGIKVNSVVEGPSVYR